MGEGCLTSVRTAHGAPGAWRVELANADFTGKINLTME